MCICGYTYIFYIFVYDKLIDFFLKTKVFKCQERHLLTGHCQPTTLTFPPSTSSSDLQPNAHQGFVVAVLAGKCSCNVSRKV